MIRWIRKNLCTSSFSEVTPTKNLHVVDIRDLVDKKGNTSKIVKSKVDEVLQSLKKGKKVAICCDYGISRSNSIAAGVLSLYEGISMKDAIKSVLKKTDEKSIKIEVLSTVSKAIEKNPKKNVNYKKLRIMVTGSSGFIGKKIIPELKKEFHVFTSSHDEIDLIENIVELDQFVKEHNIDMLIHFANPRIYTTNDSMGKSLIMLKNILDVCLENKLFLVFPSGWEIYSGYKTKQMNANEKLFPKPGNTYGYTKFLSESLIQMYHTKFELKYTIIRSSPIYGIDGDKPKFIWNFLDKAMNNKDIFTHKYINGHPKLDLLNIDDYIKAVRMIVKKRIQGSINVFVRKNIFIVHGFI